MLALFHMETLLVNFLEIFPLKSEVYSMGKLYCLCIYYCEHKLDLLLKFVLQIFMS